MVEFEVEAYTEKNILYVKAEGNYKTAEEAKKVGKEMIKKSRDLEDGWSTISDIREVSSIKPEASDVIDEYQEKLDQAGARSVVRVVTETNKVAQMSFQVGGEFEFQEYEAESVEEAEDIIEEERQKLSNL